MILKGEYALLPINLKYQMASTSSVMKLLVFFVALILIILPSYDLQLQIAAQADRGPVINLKCNTTQDCTSPNKCLCKTCTCVNNECICSVKAPSIEKLGRLKY
uniref:Uncharacterized protein n=1 Tax=Manihot esculenta TaxID=3983 RepID=A0A2C9VUH5_MANES